MDNYKQINYFIEKGLFDNNLKEKNRKKKRKEKIKRISLSVVILFFLSIFVFAFQPTPNSQTESSLINENKENESEKKNILGSLFLSSEKDNLIKEEINILALGRPGQGYSGGNLTDTIILINLNPNNKATLISLPRDFLVKNEKYGYLTKINSIYNSEGIEALKEKITKITGLSVNKYVIVDLVVVKEIINSIDGLNIFVPQDINDPFFPGPNNSYQSFNLASGWRYLDGSTALKYIRTRYTSPNGDFDRMTRQQQVINLLKQKVLALNPLWDFPTYLKIFNTLNKHIETDLGVMEIKDLWQTVKEIQIDNIANVVIDKKETGLLTGGQVPFGDQMASVVYPKMGQGNYDEIKRYIQEIINKN